jgi:hypothetical protein
MKNLLVLSIWLLNSPFLSAYSQETINQTKNVSKLSPISIDMSYSPRYAFDFNKLRETGPYRLYLNGFNCRLVHKIDSERVSISIGVGYRKKDIFLHNPNDEVRIAMFDFPIQLDYHLKKKADKFDPYIKSSLRVCYDKEKYNYSIVDIENVRESEYTGIGLIADIGYGSIVKVYKDFHLFFESSIGYSLTNNFPNRAYIDLYLGIKINF